MDYCIVENGTIVNMIVCENDEIAAEFGALPSYEGAYIGGAYEPPPKPPEPEPEPEPAGTTLEARMEALETETAALTAAIERGLSL